MLSSYDCEKSRDTIYTEPTHFVRSNVTFQSYADCKLAASNCCVGESALRPIDKQLLNVPLQYCYGSRAYVIDNEASNTSIVLSPQQRVKKHYVYKCTLHKNCAFQVSTQFHVYLFLQPFSHACIMYLSCIHRSSIVARSLLDVRQNLNSPRRSLT